MNFKRINIGTKLAVGFSILIVLLISLAGISINRLNKINNSLNKLNNVYNKRIQLADEIKNDVTVIKISTLNIMTSTDLTYMKKQKSTLDDAIKLYDEHKKELKDLIDTDKGRDLFNDVEDKEKVGLPVLCDAAVKAMDPNLNQATLNTLVVSLDAPYTNWMTSIQNIVDYQNQLANDASKIETETTQHSIYVMYSLVIYKYIISSFSNV